MSLPNDPQAAIARITADIEPGLIEIRRDIHAHPELAFEEVRTAGVVARELTRLGIAHQTGIAKTGVVAVLNCGTTPIDLAAAGLAGEVLIASGEHSADGVLAPDTAVWLRA